jgi:uncharacterized membrane protein
VCSPGVVGSVRSHDGTKRYPLDRWIPMTTETTTLPRPADEVFRYLADFGNLAEWDPMFDRSERLDDGPLGVGSRFRVVGSVAGSELTLDLEIVEYDPAGRVVFHGTGDGLRTREDLQVSPEAMAAR